MLSASAYNQGAEMKLITYIATTHHPTELNSQRWLEYMDSWGFHIPGCKERCANSIGAAILANQKRGQMSTEGMTNMLPETPRDSEYTPKRTRTNHHINRPI